MILLTAACALAHHAYLALQGAGTGSVDMSPMMCVQGCDMERCLSIDPEMPPVNCADLLRVNQQWCDGCQQKSVHPTCTVTPLYWEHMHCCALKLHFIRENPTKHADKVDRWLGRRKCLCDDCTRAVVCEESRAGGLAKAVSRLAGARGRGKW